ncbi:DNA alkylation repair protein [Brevibacillus dissolubilis]|uniref:DNA alkylation repair protein n=1 Tax=Brevibacillus dissolubilis TaxID=1844116 RepID=UPI001116280B|nr:DNA alkylation repair protein [Brevibacillus dissolubilis]
MTELSQVLDHMREFSDPRAVAIWAKVGMPTDTYIGVSLTNLKTIAKTIKKNHDLALTLWQTGIHDARLLATMIEEPKQVTLDQIIHQSDDFDFWDLADKYCKNVIGKTTMSSHFIDLWKDSDIEMKKRSAYILLSGYAGQKKTGIDDSYFESFLRVIQDSITTEKNWVKEAMIYALIGIGSRNPHLHEQALSVARHVGTIEVDYGDTSCQTPDPIKILTSDRTKKKLEA